MRVEPGSLATQGYRATFPQLDVPGAIIEAYEASVYRRGYVSYPNQAAASSDGSVCFTSLQWHRLGNSTLTKYCTRQALFPERVALLFAAFSRGVCGPA